MLARLIAYARGIARRRAISSEVEDELRFHLEQEIEAHVARGASPAEARRRALRDLGGLTQTKEAVREVRAIWGSGLAHDSRLGLRMVRKYPGLTLAGGLALAIAVGIGAAWYDFTGDLLRPSLPFPDGTRIVEIEMRNPMISGDERRVLHDFLIWKRDARLIGDLGAYRTVERNLVLGDARTEPVTVAETTASAFRVTRVRPLMGRTLLDGDEQPGARAVIVLGFGVWQQQFGARPDVIGQTVQLGRTTTTVVGGHAARLRVSGEPQAVGAASTSTVGIPAARGSGGSGVRPARAECDSSAGVRRDHRTGGSSDGCLSSDARASASARAGIRR